MDLAEHGRVDLAESFVARYAREASDYDLYPLIDFYEGYRAYVRGKVATLLAADEEAGLETRERAEKNARRHFLLALAAQRRSMLSPAVVAVGGIIASGKSTVAERIGKMMSAPVVDTDRTRKFLAGAEATERLSDGAWRGAYSPEQTRRVYAEVFRRAERVLASGRPVVIDASFRSQDDRRAARALAERAKVPFYFVECRASKERVHKRLLERERQATVSDGRVELLDDFVAKFEPTTDVPADRHIVVDTDRPMDDNVAVLERALPTWPDGMTG
jgi:predicted kinase